MFFLLILLLIYLLWSTDFYSFWSTDAQIQSFFSTLFTHIHIPVQVYRYFLNFSDKEVCTGDFFEAKLCSMHVNTEWFQCVCCVPPPPALRSRHGHEQLRQCLYRSAASGRALNPAASSCLCRPWTSGRSSLRAPSLMSPSHCAPVQSSEEGWGGHTQLTMLCWQGQMVQHNKWCECGHGMKRKLCVCVFVIWGMKFAWKAVRMRSQSHKHLARRIIHLTTYSVTSLSVSVGQYHTANICNTIV